MSENKKGGFQTRQPVKCNAKKYVLQILYRFYKKVKVILIVIVNFVIATVIDLL